MKKLKQQLERKGIKFQALSLFFNMKKVVHEAKEEAKSLGGRHDIPHSPKIPSDLQDSEGSWQLTKEGYPITGRILSHELTVGSTSPMVPAYLAGWVFIAPLLAVFPMVGKCLALAYVLGLFGYIGTTSTLAMLFFVLAPATAIAFIPAGVNAVMPMSPAFIVGLIPALLPFAHWFVGNKTRAMALLAMGKLHNGAVLGAPKTGRSDARWAQALNASKDKAHFIPLGQAKGAFTRVGDAYAPDEGMELGLTTSDASKHILILGSTGTGKTSSGLRPIIAAINQEEEHAMQEAIARLEHKNRGDNNE